LGLLELILVAGTGILCIPESFITYNKPVTQNPTKINLSFNPKLNGLSKTFIWLLQLSFVSQLAFSLFEGAFALHSQRLFSFCPQQMSIVFIICCSLISLLQLGLVTWLIDKKGENILLPFGFFSLSIGIFMLISSWQMDYDIIQSFRLLDYGPRTFNFYLFGDTKKKIELFNR